VVANFSENDKVWWNKQDDDALDSALSAYSSLARDDSRNNAYRVFMSLYTNRDISTQHVTKYFQAATDVEGNKFSRVPFNLIKIVIDAVMSRVAKLRPRPIFLTEDGNYSLQRKAKRLQKWVDTQFYLTNIYESGVDSALDACVFGTGAIKIYACEDKIRAERVYPGELYVDELEALYGNPQQLFQRKFISKDTLKTLFPKFEEEINKSGMVSTNYYDDIGYTPLIEQIEVIEAWHLPSSSSSKDGRHIIFIEDAVLVDEKYPYDSFPFAFYRWGKEVRGFYGVGLAEDLLGIHLDVNNTIRRIERNAELLATPQVWIETNSKVSASKITNIPGSVNTYSNTPPIFMQHQVIPRDLFEYMQNQIARGFQIAGLSDSAVGRKIPPGLETGQAVRDFHDVETERFILPAKRLEQFYMDLAKLIIRVSKQISQKYPKYSVVAEKDKYTIESIPWKDIDINEDKDAYVMKVFPASSLSQTPAGRKGDIQDYLQMGVITPQEARRLLDFPDLEQSSSLAVSASDNIDRIIENILDENKYEAPEPFMDLELAFKKAQDWINKATRMGVPEQNISKLRLFATQCVALIKKAEQEQLMQQQMLSAASVPVGGNGTSRTAATGNEL
jgi:hypothetical protein